MLETKAQKVLQDEQCFEIIRKKLRQDAMDDFSLVGYEIVPIDKVNGFLGQYFTLKATVACPKSPLETRSINFFTKIPPPISSPQYHFIQAYGTFKKEVALYTTVFPEMLDGLDKRCIPECFLGIENDVIVLEDMAHSGYTMTDKYIPFDLQHCAILMKTLAKFHAKSFVFERQYKKSLHDEFSHCMHETLWPRADDRAKAMIDAAVKGVVSMIDLLPGLSNDQRGNFKERVVQFCADHTDKLSPSVKHKNVLCHGDLWANNVLFKYDADGRPVECCLIDFQLARYNPPAHDILCFLQFTTTRKLRDEHSETLFKAYHDSMASVLKEADLDISEVLPWKEFVESIQDLRTMCVAHGVLNTPIMLLKPNAASKYFCEQPELLESILFVDRTPLVCDQFKEVPEYRARMIDGLLELHDHI
ncbi:uncharacterized protein LOC105181683 [Harpegnathos saltator]|uniref:CHK kinase-like domain-containing protein n=1 Tax=Harpegnathos saltator TaxID=610380 RepID=E2BDR5_HARSA|nr:uncharacterized protein LOC105181683 [Harpegnathos saltator]EFN86121.1 hypothetical protein EAI_13589 [Harpegnathos saltator]